MKRKLLVVVLCLSGITLGLVMAVYSPTSYQPAQETYESHPVGDEYDSVVRWIKTGQYERAGEMADQVLKEKPNSEAAERLIELKALSGVSGFSHRDCQEIRDYFDRMRL